MSRVRREVPPVYQRGRWIWAVILIGLAAVYPYRPAGENGLIYDDIAIVQDNLRVQDLNRIGEIFLTEYWNVPEMHSRLYRPVTLLSCAVEHVLWGPEPGHFHRVNVALHALVRLMVFLLAAILLRGLRRCGGSNVRTEFSLFPALVIGLLFAVHPLHSEAVAGIVGRAELLAALFSLGIVCALLQGETGSSTGNRRIGAPPMPLQGAW